MLRVGMLLCLLCGWAVADEDKELAQQRFRTGQALFRRGRVPEALREFEEGKKSFPLPAFDFNIGLCLAKLDRPSEASDALQRYIDAKPDDSDAAGIWKMIAELRAEVARSPMRPSPSPEPVVRPALTTLPNTTGPPPPVDARRMAFTRAAIATVTIGGVMLLTSVITGSAALRQRNAYDTHCDDGRCMDDEFSSAHKLAISTDVLIPLGAALVVTSIVLFVKRPPAAPKITWGVSF